MFVQLGEQRGGKIDQIRQQPQLPGLTAAVDVVDQHLAQQDLGRGIFPARGVAGGQMTQAVAHHTGVLCRLIQRQFALGFKSDTFAQTTQKMALPIQDAAQVTELGHTAVEQINQFRVGIFLWFEQRGGGGAFADAVITGDADSIGQAGLETKLAIQPHRSHHLLVGLALMQRPLDISRHAKVRSIHRLGFFQQAVQLIILLMQMGKIFAQLLDQSLQMIWTEQRVGIGQGAFADTFHREILLHTRHLAGIFDPPQTAKRGTEKRYEISEHHIIIKQHAPMVRVKRAKTCQINLEGREIIATAKMLGLHLGIFLASAFERRE